MRAFRAAPDGLEAVLEPVERDVLGGVVRDVLELLLADGNRAGAADDPTAPADTDELPARPDELDDRPDDHLDDQPDEDPDEDSGLAPFAVPAAALPPADPALARLLPDASRQDAQVAAEFRRLTQDDLRATKVAGLDLLVRTLTVPPPGDRSDRVLVRVEDAGRFAAAITDVRLVLAERLGLRTDADAEALHAELAAPRRRRDRDSHRRALGEVYDALTWWQETLMDVLLAGLPEPPELPGTANA